MQAIPTISQPYYLDGSDLVLDFHPGQWQAWDSIARFVVVLAGTQGGKPSFGPHWLYREIQRRGPGDYMVVTPTYKLLNLKALPELKRILQTVMGLGQYKAGDKVADATIVAVAPTAVTVEWDGKTKVFNPIDGGASSGPSRSSRPRSFSSGTNGPQMVVTRSAAGANPRALDGATVKKMKKTYEDMSKDQRDKFKKCAPTGQHII